MRVALSCLAILFVVLPAHGQDSVDIAGLWKATLSTGPADLRLLLEIEKGEGGALTASVDSLDQGAEDLHVDRITFEGGVLEFEMTALGASFRGESSTDSRRIVGTFQQGGAQLPLTWVRTDQAPVLVRPQEPGRPFPYLEERVRYCHDPAGHPAEVQALLDDSKPDDRVCLAGTLTQPRTGAPHPAVVLVSGSGRQDRDETVFGHRPFLVLADALTRRGIAVLRYDDRGVAESTGDFGTALTTDFAQDALAGVYYLRSRSDIASERIGIAGHSEGGLVAPLAANQSKDVAFIVLMAGTSVSGAEVVEHQGRLIARALGVSESLVEREAESKRSIFELVQTVDDRDELASRVASLLEDAYDELPPALTGPSADKESFVKAQLPALTSPWFRFFLSYDPVPALQEVQCPVLAIFGEKDLQVDPGQNLLPMKKALEQNDDATVLELAGLNHLFQTSVTGAPNEYAKIEETFAPIALQTVTDWIAERFVGEAR